MAKIGFLKSVGIGSRAELHGDMQTLQMRLRIKLIQNDRKTTDKAPDYVVCAAGDHGDVPVGSAWRRAKAGDADREFISITIDDPSFATPLNLAAFKTDEGGYDLTWSRPKLKTAS
jgi:uncharacterized protein (DUF736 family)